MPAWRRATTKRIFLLSPSVRIVRCVQCTHDELLPIYRVPSPPALQCCNTPVAGTPRSLPAAVGVVACDVVPCSLGFWPACSRCSGATGLGVTGMLVLLGLV